MKRKLLCHTVCKMSFSELVAQCTIAMLVLKSANLPVTYHLENLFNNLKNLSTNAIPSVLSKKIAMTPKI